MAYYVDLSAYSYGGRPGKGALNVGWLCADHPYPKGEAPAGFLERLAAFCRISVNETRGYHACDLCPGGAAMPQSIPYAEEYVLLGSAEIRVFASAKRRLPSGEPRAYAAPDLVYHYVREHRYLPPVEFIDAVLSGALPGSPEYQRLAASHGWYGSYGTDPKRAFLNEHRRQRLRKIEHPVRAVRSAFPEIDSDELAAVVYHLGTASSGGRDGETLRILTRLDEEAIDLLARAVPSLISRRRVDPNKVVYSLATQTRESLLKFAAQSPRGHERADESQ